LKIPKTDNQKRKSKKDIKHNGQEKNKHQRSSNDLEKRYTEN